MTTPTSPARVPVVAAMSPAQRVAINAPRQPSATVEGPDERETIERSAESLDLIPAERVGVDVRTHHRRAADERPPRWRVGVEPQAACQACLRLQRDHQGRMDGRLA